MKKIVAIIEKASDGGYGIYCPDVTGLALFGYGSTEKEAKENLQENLEVILEHCEEENKPIPEILNIDKISFEYKYDFPDFFRPYPFFNMKNTTSYPYRKKLNYTTIG